MKVKLLCKNIVSIGTNVQGQLYIRQCNNICIKNANVCQFHLECSVDKLRGYFFERDI